MLGNRHGGVTDAKAYRGAFVHLAEHHDGVSQHPGLFHFAVELFRLARAFANAAEQAHALIDARHVVDHLGDQHGLANARSAEEPRLATSLDGTEQVDCFDAGLEYLGPRPSFVQAWRGVVDRAPRRVRKRRAAIDRLAEQVQHSAERRPPHRHLDSSLARAQSGAERHRLPGGQHQPTGEPPAGQCRDLDPQIGIVETDKKVPRLG